MCVCVCTFEFGKTEVKAPVSHRANILFLFKYTIKTKHNEHIQVDDERMWCKYSRHGFLGQGRNCNPSVWKYSLAIWMSIPVFCVQVCVEESGREGTMGKLDFKKKSILICYSKILKPDIKWNKNSANDFKILPQGQSLGESIIIAPSVSLVLNLGCTKKNERQN